MYQEQQWYNCLGLMCHSFVLTRFDIFDLLLDISILAVSLSNTPTSHAVT